MGGNAGTPKSKIENRKFAVIWSGNVTLHWVLKASGESQKKQINVSKVFHQNSKKLKWKNIVNNPANANALMKIMEYVSSGYYELIRASNFYDEEVESRAASSKYATTIYYVI